MTITQTLFEVDDDHGRAARMARTIANAGGGHHAALERHDGRLAYVDCSCGRPGLPGVTMADAYSPHLTHLRVLAADVERARP